jgi:hypothetical protein
MRELEERRFGEMRAPLEARGDETLAKIAETAERRKAVDQAQRRHRNYGARCARTGRPSSFPRSRNRSHAS